MRKYGQLIVFSLMLAAALLISGCTQAPLVPADATEQVAFFEMPSTASEFSNSPLEQTALYLLEAAPNPSFGSVFGEWLVLGLARSGVAVPEGYFEGYYSSVVTHLQGCDGVLDAHKNTEYSRLILALTSIGKDPTDVGGYNLLIPLADFEQTCFQGITGPAFALLALDSGGYAIPQNTQGTTQASRSLYLAIILENELSDGGWSLFGGEADVDITAMVLQALANYRDQPEVEAAIERGLQVLSTLQNANGGYTTYGADNSESVAQVLLALTQLGMDPSDARFVKNGKTLDERLREFSVEDGAFRHIAEGSADQMATEQAFYALVAYERFLKGESPLYSMNGIR